jgi:hypothetical protein
MTVRLGAARQVFASAIVLSVLAGCVTPQPYELAADDNGTDEDYNTAI